MSTRVTIRGPNGTIAVIIKTQGRNCKVTHQGTTLLKIMFLGGGVSYLEHVYTYKLVKLAELMALFHQIARQHKCTLTQLEDAAHFEVGRVRVDAKMYRWLVQNKPCLYAAFGYAPTCAAPSATLLDGAAAIDSTVGAHPNAAEPQVESVAATTVLGQLSPAINALHPRQTEFDINIRQQAAALPAAEGAETFTAYLARIDSDDKKHIAAALFVLKYVALGHFDEGTGRARPLSALAFDGALSSFLEAVGRRLVAARSMSRAMD